MKIYYSKKNILLALSIFIFFSYLFQIYLSDISEVVNGVLYIKGGTFQRNLIKFCGIFLFYVVLYREFSFRSFKYNFALKIPLLYYLITLIFIAPLIFQANYMNAGAHRMALNLVLFFPVLFINFSGENGNELFFRLIKIVIWVVCIQLFIDLLIKLLSHNYLNIILGGMGNANTFGLHLIIASLGLRFIYNKLLLSNLVLLFTLGTGSLICSLIAIILIIVNLFSISFKRISIKTLLIILILLAISLMWKENISNVILNELGGSLNHAEKKIRNLLLLEFDKLGSIRGRLNWIHNNIQLMLDNPLSIFFGHPNFIPLKTGDGFFITLLVTLGLPALLLFILSHLYLIRLGIKEKTSLSKFSSYTLMVYMFFFFTNRILDYWPAGFIYMLVFTYLIRFKKKLNNKTGNSFNY